MKHPTSIDWALFFRSGVRLTKSVEMAHHLGKCKYCRKVIDALPSPPRRILGRPLPIPSGTTPVGLEYETLKLLSHVRENAVIRIGGAWHSETLVYEVLALAVAQLNRQRGDVCIAGLVRYRDACPSPPNHPIAILLEAPTYDNVDSWLIPKVGQARILVGETEVWRGQGIRPDILIEGNPADSDFESYIRRIEDGAHSDHQVVRAGIIANALSVDWPMRFLEAAYIEGGSLPFVSVENLESQLTGYVCTEGPWLSGHFLRSRPQLAAALWHDLQTVDIGLLESTRCRLARQWSHWGQTQASFTRTALSFAIRRPGSQMD